jgi:hypothetical protein
MHGAKGADYSNKKKPGNAIERLRANKLRRRLEKAEIERRNREKMWVKMGDY